MHKKKEIVLHIYFPIDLSKNTKWLIDFDSTYYINNRNDEIYTIDNLKEERKFINKCINNLKKEISKFDEFKKKYDLYDFELYEKGKLFFKTNLFLEARKYDLSTTYIPFLTATYSNTTKKWKFEYAKDIFKH